MLARLALEKTPAAALRCESSTARFFENAFDVISEAGSNELEEEFRQLLHRFLRSRNLRYELSEPFRLQSHLPGIFSALFSDLVATIRALEVNDSIIVPLLLLTAAGYFAPNANMLDTFRSQASEPKQQPPDPPVMAEPHVSTAVT